MADSTIPPLDPSLASLLEGERGRTSGPAPSKDAAYARITAKLAQGAVLGAALGAATRHSSLAPAGVKAGAVATTALGKSVPALLLAFALGTATGSLVTALVLHRPAEPAASGVAAPVVASPPVVAGSAADTPKPPGLPGDTPKPPGSPAAPAPLATATEQAMPRPSAAQEPTRIGSAAVATDRTLAEERRILDRAQMALTRGDPGAAIGAAEEHQARFPAGQLEAEREAILIQALVVAHRGEEARARAARFRARYPNSVFRRVVELAIGVDEK